MKKYVAYLQINNELTKIEFETDSNPVDFLWQRYGMSTYIERIIQVENTGTESEKE